MKRKDISERYIESMKNVAVVLKLIVSTVRKLPVKTIICFKCTYSASYTDNRSGY